MKNLAAQVSGVAMLALAALPIVALPAHALAATTTVRVSDLNLTTAEGSARFQLRAERAARNYCGDRRDLSAAAHCRKGVKAELNEKVAVVRAAQIEKATTFAAR